MFRFAWMLYLSLLFPSMAVFAAAHESQFLSATVKNLAIANAEVTFQRNGFPSAVGKTDKQGLLRLSNAPFNGIDDDSVLMIARKPGYSPLVVKCPCNGLTYALSEHLTGLDSIRVVLTWGKHPNDLDSHLLYRDNHVFYKSKSGDKSSLDVDDTNSFGPETITIADRPDGERYVYAVVDFSNRAKAGSTGLGRSGARVDLYIGQTLVRSYRPRKVAARAWIPFIIDRHGQFVDMDMYIDDEREIDAMLQVNWAHEHPVQLLGLLNGDYANQVGRTISNAQTSVASQVQPVRPSAQSSSQNSTSADAVARNKEGERAYHAGDYDKAIRLYREAIDMNAGYGQAYSNLGLAYQKAGRIAEAMWANRRAIALASGKNKAIVQASSYYNIARIYESQQRWERALQNYRYAKGLRKHRAYDEGIARMQEKLKSAGHG